MTVAQKAMPWCSMRSKWADAHRLAPGDAAIVAILDTDALDAVGAQPVDDLVARAREAHRAACRLAHSSTLPFVGSRGRTITAEAHALKAAAVWALPVVRAGAGPVILMHEALRRLGEGRTGRR